ncbi:hypothetical protein [Schlesneria paludicola]|uniref:hypothetical protein n=1 Tax=Schlesneria paludicola TaxID=360056 RepID=UPI00029ACAAC|nr:hypothetical protein [Schlesneria paludicola]
MTFWISSVRLSGACLLAVLSVGTVINNGKSALAADQPERKGKLSIGVTANDDPAEQTPKPAPPKRRRGDDDDEMSTAMTPNQPTTPAVAGTAPTAGTLPGAGNLPGQPGRTGRPVQTGGPAPSTFAAGSADDALYRFCIALADGDTATASDYVSHSAVGIAAKLREGELPEAKIEEISESLKPFDQLQNVQARRPSNIKRSVRNQRSGQVISFVLKKEKEIYKIVEVSVSKAKDAADTRDRS